MTPIRSTRDQFLRLLCDLGGPVVVHVRRFGTRHVERLQWRPVPAGRRWALGGLVGSVAVAVVVVSLDRIPDATVGQAVGPAAVIDPDAAPVKMVDAAPRGPTCEEQVWPYIEQRCLRRVPDGTAVAVEPAAAVPRPEAAAAPSRSSSASATPMPPPPVAPVVPAAPPVPPETAAAAAASSEPAGRDVPAATVVDSNGVALAARPESDLAGAAAAAAAASTGGAAVAGRRATGRRAERQRRGERRSGRRGPLLPLRMFGLRF